MNLLRAIFCAAILGAPIAVDAQRLSPLAPQPNWAQLERFQETISRAEFTALLENVYAPDGAAAGLIEVQNDHAIIRTTLAPAATWTLRFAPDSAAPNSVPRIWRPAAALPLARREQPLAGVKIALDPGHLGARGRAWKSAGSRSASRCR
jgi:hypothetical protein